MKPLIVAIVAASVALGASAAGSAVSHASAAAQPGCTDSCSIAAHRSQPGTVVADDGMQTMPGMQPQPGSSPMAMPMHGGHMEMTPPRAASAQDQERADQIIAALRVAMAPYKDYRAAEAAGYVPFHPEISQPVYHFTNLHNAMLNQFSFDPSRPTSLMYQPVDGGYQLVGAMYTAPRKSTLDQLDARVPLGIATWHLHVNLCIPPVGMGREMLGPHAQFGLAGSITTADACAAAGGTFKPVVYGWMVHVWPYESDPTKVWATEDHPGAMDH